MREYEKEKNTSEDDAREQRARVILLGSTSSWLVFLPGLRGLATIGTVSAAIQQTLPEIFESLPKNENEWPEDLRKDLEQFVELTKSENGLIPKSAAPACFDVSRQRWDQMCKEYSFKSWMFFGKRFYSRIQLEEFSKIDRNALRGNKSSKNHKLVRMLKDTLSEANKTDS